jgi:hypothetical protein
MEDPSTIRRAVGVVAIDLAPYEGIRDRTNGKPQDGGAVRVENNVPYLFYVRNMFF